MTRQSVRRLVLYGAPLLAALLLAFHPAPDFSNITAISVFDYIAPVVDRFIWVHILFAPVIVLLGTAVQTLTAGLNGIAARLSRWATYLYVAFYIAYESIIGTATGALVRTTLQSAPEAQASVVRIANALWMHPVTGDFPAFIPLVASLAWMVAVVGAAVAVGQLKVPLGARILLGLSLIGAIHAPPIGPAAMLLFLGAVAWMDRAVRISRDTYEMAATAT